MLLLCPKEHAPDELQLRAARRLPVLPEVHQTLYLLATPQPSVGQGEGGPASQGERILTARDGRTRTVRALVRRHHSSAHPGDGPGRGFSSPSGTSLTTRPPRKSMIRSAPAVAVAKWPS